MRQSTKKKYTISLIIFLFLCLATVSAFFLMKSNQDTRQQASGACQAGDPYCSCDFWGSNCVIVDPDGARTIVEQGSEANNNGVLSTSFTGTRPTTEGTCTGMWMSDFCYMPGDEIAGGYIMVESGKYSYPHFEKKEVYESTSYGAETVTNRLGSTSSLGDNCGGEGLAIDGICWAYGSTINGYLVMPARTSDCDNATGDYCYAHLEKIETSYEDWQAAVNAYESTGDYSQLEDLYETVYGIPFEVGSLYDPDAPNSEILRAQSLVAALTNAEVLQADAAAQNAALEAKGDLTPQEQALYDFNQQIINDDKFALRYQQLDQLTASTAQQTTINKAVQDMYQELVVAGDGDLASITSDKFVEIFGYDPRDKYGGVNGVLEAFGINPEQLNQDREAYTAWVEEQEAAQAAAEAEAIAVAEEEAEENRGNVETLNEAISGYGIGTVSESELKTIALETGFLTERQVMQMTMEEILAYIYSSSPDLEYDEAADIADGIISGRETILQEQNLLQSIQNDPTNTSALESLYQLYNGHETPYRMTTEELTLALAESNPQIALQAYLDTGDITYLQQGYEGSSGQICGPGGCYTPTNELALLEGMFDEAVASDIYDNFVVPRLFSEAVNDFAVNPDDLESLCSSVLNENCNLSDENASARLGEALEVIYAGQEGVNIDEMTIAYSNQLMTTAEEEKDAAWWEMALANISMAMSGESLAIASLTSDTAAEALESQIAYQSETMANYSAAIDTANIFDAQDTFTYASTADVRANLSDYTWGTALGNAVMYDNVFDREYDLQDDLGLGGLDAVAMTWNQIETQAFNVTNNVENIATNYAVAMQQGYTGPANTNVADITFQAAQNLNQDAFGYDYQEAQGGHYARQAGSNVAATVADWTVTAATYTGLAMQNSSPTPYYGAVVTTTYTPDEIADLARDAGDDVAASIRQSSFENIVADYNQVAAEAGTTNTLDLDQYVTFQTDEEIVRSRQELNWETVEKVVAPTAAVIALPVAIASGAGIGVVAGVASSAFSLYQGAGARAAALEMDRVIISDDFDNRMNAAALAVVQNEGISYNDAEFETAYSEAMETVEGQIDMLEKQGNMMLASSAVGALTSGAGIINGFTSGAQAAMATGQTINTGTQLAINTSQVMSTAGRVGGIALSSYNAFNSGQQAIGAAQALGALDDAVANGDMTQAEADAMAANLRGQVAMSGLSSFVAASGVVGNSFGFIRNPSLQTQAITTRTDLILDIMNVPAGVAVDAQNVSQSCYNENFPSTENDCRDAWIGLALSVVQDVAQVRNSVGSYKQYQYDQVTNQVAVGDLAQRISLTDQRLTELLNNPNRTITENLELTDLRTYRQSLVTDALAINSGLVIPDLIKPVAAIEVDVQKITETAGNNYSNLMSRASQVEASDPALAATLRQQAADAFDNQMNVLAIRDQIDAIDNKIDQDFDRMTDLEIENLRTERDSLVDSLESRVNDPAFKASNLDVENQKLIASLKANETFKAYDDFKLAEGQENDLERLNLPPPEETVQRKTGAAALLPGSSEQNRALDLADLQTRILEVDDLNSQKIEIERDLAEFRSELDADDPLVQTLATRLADINRQIEAGNQEVNRLLPQEIGSPNLWQRLTGALPFGQSSRNYDQAMLAMRDMASLRQEMADLSLRNEELSGQNRLSDEDIAELDDIARQLTAANNKYDAAERIVNEISGRAESILQPTEQSRVGAWFAGVVGGIRNPFSGGGDSGPDFQSAFDRGYQEADLSQTRRSEEVAAIKSELFAAKNDYNQLIRGQAEVKKVAAELAALNELPRPLTAEQDVRLNEIKAQVARVNELESKLLKPVLDTSVRQKLIEAQGNGDLEAVLATVRVAELEKANDLNLNKNQRQLIDDILAIKTELATKPSNLSELRNDYNQKLSELNKSILGDSPESVDYQKLSSVQQFLKNVSALEAASSAIDDAGAFGSILFSKEASIPVDDPLLAARLETIIRDVEFRTGASEGIEFFNARSNQMDTFLKILEGERVAIELTTAGGKTFVGSALLRAQTEVLGYDTGVYIAKPGQEAEIQRAMMKAYGVSEDEVVILDKTRIGDPDYLASLLSSRFVVSDPTNLQFIRNSANNFDDVSFADANAVYRKMTQNASLYIDELQINLDPGRQAINSVGASSEDIPAAQKDVARLVGEVLDATLLKNGGWGDGDNDFLVLRTEEGAEIAKFSQSAQNDIFTALANKSGIAAEDYNLVKDNAIELERALNQGPDVYTQRAEALGIKLSAAEAERIFDQIDMVNTFAQGLKMKAGTDYQRMIDDVLANNGGPNRKVTVPAAGAVANKGQSYNAKLQAAMEYIGARSVGDSPNFDGLTSSPNLAYKSTIADYLGDLRNSSVGAVTGAMADGRGVVETALGLVTYRSTEAVEKILSIEGSSTGERINVDRSYQINRDNDVDALAALKRSGALNQSAGQESNGNLKVVMGFDGARNPLDFAIEMAKSKAFAGAEYCVQNADGSYSRVSIDATGEVQSNRPIEVKDIQDLYDQGASNLITIIGRGGATGDSIKTNKSVPGVTVTSFDTPEGLVAQAGARIDRGSDIADQYALIINRSTDPANFRTSDSLANAKMSEADFERFRLQVTEVQKTVEQAKNTQALDQGVAAASTRVLSDLIRNSSDPEIQKWASAKLLDFYAEGRQRDLDLYGGAQESLVARQKKIAAEVANWQRLFADPANSKILDTIKQTQPDLFRQMEINSGVNNAKLKYARVESDQKESVMTASNLDEFVDRHNRFVTADSESSYVADSGRKPQTNQVATESNRNTVTADRARVRIDQVKESVRGLRNISLNVSNPFRGVPDLVRGLRDVSLNIPNPLRNASSWVDSVKTSEFSKSLVKLPKNITTYVADLNEQQRNARILFEAQSLALTELEEKLKAETDPIVQADLKEQITQVEEIIGEISPVAKASSNVIAFYKDRVQPGWEKAKDRIAALRGAEQEFPEEVRLRKERVLAELKIGDGDYRFEFDSLRTIEEIDAFVESRKAAYQSIKDKFASLNTSVPAINDEEALLLQSNNLVETVAEITRLQEASKLAYLETDEDGLKQDENGLYIRVNQDQFKTLGVFKTKAASEEKRLAKEAADLKLAEDGELKAEEERIAGLVNPVTLSLNNPALDLDLTFLGKKVSLIDILDEIQGGVIPEMEGETLFVKYETDEELEAGSSFKKTVGIRVENGQVIPSHFRGKNASLNFGVTSRPLLENRTVELWDALGKLADVEILSWKDKEVVFVNLPRVGYMELRLEEGQFIKIQNADGSTDQIDDPSQLGFVRGSHTPIKNLANLDNAVGGIREENLRAAEEAERARLAQEEEAKQLAYQQLKDQFRALGTTVQAINDDESYQTQLERLTDLINEIELLQLESGLNFVETNSKGEVEEIGDIYQIARIDETETLSAFRAAAQKEISRLAADEEARAEKLAREEEARKSALAEIEKLREAYPGIILPEDVEGQGYSFFHEIFRRSVAAKGPVYFAVGGAAYTYEYSLEDDNFEQGVEVAPEQISELDPNVIKANTIDSVAATFDMQIALDEAGYKYDEYRNLVDGDGQVLLANAQETERRRKLGVRWQAITNVADSLATLVPQNMALSVLQKNIAIIEKLIEKNQEIEFEVADSSFDVEGMFSNLKNLADLFREEKNQVEAEAERLAEAERAKQLAYQQLKDQFRVLGTTVQAINDDETYQAQLERLTDLITEIEVLQLESGLQFLETNAKGEVEKDGDLYQITRIDESKTFSAFRSEAQREIARLEADEKAQAERIAREEAEARELEAIRLANEEADRLATAERLEQALLEETQLGLELSGAERDKLREQAELEEQAAIEEAEASAEKEYSTIILGVREQYPGIILPEDINGRGFTLFHEVFRRSVTSNGPVFFSVWGIVFEYQYSLDHTSFSEGVKIISAFNKANDPVEIKEKVVDKISSQFSMQIALDEAGYRYDINGNLVDRESNILMRSSESTKAKEELALVWGDIINFVDGLADLVPQNMTLDVLQRNLVAVNNLIAQIQRSDFRSVASSQEIKDILYNLRASAGALAEEELAQETQRDALVANNEEENLDLLEDKIKSRESVKGSFTNLLWTHNTSASSLAAIFGSKNFSALTAKGRAYIQRRGLTEKEFWDQLSEQEASTLRDNGYIKRGFNARYGLSSDYGDVKFVFKEGFENNYNRGLSLTEKFVKKPFIADFFSLDRIAFGKRFSRENEFNKTGLLRFIAQRYDFNKYLGSEIEGGSEPSQGVLDRPYLNPQLQIAEAISLDDVQSVLVPEHLYDQVVALAKQYGFDSSKIIKVDTGSEDEYYAYNQEDPSKRSDEHKSRAITDGVMRPRQVGTVRGSSVNMVTSKKSFEAEQEAYLQLMLDLESEKEAVEEEVMTDFSFNLLMEEIGQSSLRVDLSNYGNKLNYSNGRFNLSNLYAGSAFVWQNHTVKEHTAMVYKQFRKYLSQGLSKEDSDFMTLLIALHDLGKPIERKNKLPAHIATIGIVEQFLLDAGYSDREISQFVAVIDQDFIGDLVKGDSTLEETVAGIKAKAEQSGLDYSKYFNYIYLLYMSDVASYTVDAGGFTALERILNTEQLSQGKLVLKDEHLSKIEKLEEEVTALGLESNEDNENNYETNLVINDLGNEEIRAFETWINSEELSDKFGSSLMTAAENLWKNIAIFESGRTLPGMKGSVDDFIENKGWQILGVDFLPTKSIVINNEEWFFAEKIFATAGANDGILMFKKNGDSFIPRIFYKSKSGGIWRGSPGYEGGALHKGAIEDDIDDHYVQTGQLDPRISSFLSKEIANFERIRVADYEYLFDPYFANTIGWYSFGEEIKTVRYKELEGINRYQPGVLTEENYGKITNESIAKIAFPENFIPDFNLSPELSYDETHPVLGSVTYELYGGAKFRDRDIKWLIAKDQEGRVWVSNVFYSDEELSSYGTFKTVIDCGILTSKPLDYTAQITALDPESILKTNTHYLDLTPVLDNLEPIRLYREAKGIERVGSAVVNSENSISSRNNDDSPSEAQKEAKLIGIEADLLVELDEEGLETWIKEQKEKFILMDLKFEQLRLKNPGVNNLVELQAAEDLFSQKIALIEAVQEFVPETYLSVDEQGVYILAGERSFNKALLTIAQTLSETYAIPKKDITDLYVENDLEGLIALVSSRKEAGEKLVKDAQIVVDGVSIISKLVPSDLSLSALAKKLKALESYLNFGENSATAREMIANIGDESVWPKVKELAAGFTASKREASILVYKIDRLNQRLENKLPLAVKDLEEQTPEELEKTYQEILALLEQENKEELPEAIENIDIYPWAIAHQKEIITEVQEALDKHLSLYGDLAEKKKQDLDELSEQASDSLPGEFTFISYQGERNPYQFFSSGKDLLDYMASIRVSVDGQELARVGSGANRSVYEFEHQGRPAVLKIQFMESETGKGGGWAEVITKKNLFENPDFPEALKENLPEIYDYGSHKIKDPVSGKEYTFYYEVVEKLVPEEAEQGKPTANLDLARELEKFVGSWDIAVAKNWGYRGDTPVVLDIQNFKQEATNRYQQLLRDRLAKEQKRLAYLETDNEIIKKLLSSKRVKQYSDQDLGIETKLIAKGAAAVYEEEEFLLEEKYDDIIAGKITVKEIIKEISKIINSEQERGVIDSREMFANLDEVRRQLSNDYFKDYYAVSFEDIGVYPGMQYKVTVPGSIVNTPIKSEFWDPVMAGIIDVWRNPEDGLLYVINGHHRYELAQRLRAEGKEVDSLNVRLLTVDKVKELGFESMLENGEITADAARKIGGFLNLREARGTKQDTLRFIIEQQLTEEDVIALGLNAAADNISYALKMQKLHPELLQLILDQSDVSKDGSFDVSGSYYMKNFALLADHVESKEDQLLFFQNFLKNSLPEGKTLEEAIADDRFFIMSWTTALTNFWIPKYLNFGSSILEEDSYQELIDIQSKSFSYRLSTESDFTAEEVRELEALLSSHFSQEFTEFYLYGSSRNTNPISVWRELIQRLVVSKNTQLSDFLSRVEKSDIKKGFAKQEVFEIIKTIIVEDAQSFIESSWGDRTFYNTSHVSINLSDDFQKLDINSGKWSIDLNKYTVEFKYGYGLKLKIDFFKHKSGYISVFEEGKISFSETEGDSKAQSIYHFHLEEGKFILRPIKLFGMEEGSLSSRDSFENTCSSCTEVRDQTKAGLEEVDLLWGESQRQSDLASSKLEEANSFELSGNLDRAKELELEARNFEKKAESLKKQALSQIDKTREEVITSHGMQNQCVQRYLEAWADTRQAKITQTEADINRATDSVYDATKIAEALLSNEIMESVTSNGFLGIGQKIEKIILTGEDLEQVESLLEGDIENNVLGLREMAEELDSLRNTSQVNNSFLTQFSDSIKLAIRDLGKFFRSIFASSKEEKTEGLFLSINESNQALLSVSQEYLPQGCTNCLSFTSSFKKLLTGARGSANFGHLEKMNEYLDLAQIVVNSHSRQNVIVQETVEAQLETTEAVLAMQVEDYGVIKGERSQLAKASIELEEAIVQIERDKSRLNSKGSLDSNTLQKFLDLQKSLEKLKSKIDKEVVRFDSKRLGFFDKRKFSKLSPESITPKYLQTFFTEKISTGSRSTYAQITGRGIKDGEVLEPRRDAWVVGNDKSPVALITRTRSTGLIDIKLNRNILLEERPDVQEAIENAIRELKEIYPEGLSLSLRTSELLYPSLRNQEFYLDFSSRRMRWDPDGTNLDQQKILITELERISSFGEMDNLIQETISRMVDDYGYKIGDYSEELEQTVADYLFEKIKETDIDIGSEDVNYQIGIVASKIAKDYLSEYEVWVAKVEEEVNTTIRLEIEAHNYTDWKKVRNILNSRKSSYLKDYSTSFSEQSLSSIFSEDEIYRRFGQHNLYLLDEIKEMGIYDASLGRMIEGIWETIESDQKIKDWISLKASTGEAAFVDEAMDLFVGKSFSTKLSYKQEVQSALERAVTVQRGESWQFKKTNIKISTPKKDSLLKRFANSLRNADMGYVLQRATLTVLSAITITLLVFGTTIFSTNTQVNIQQVQEQVVQEMQVLEEAPFVEVEQIQTEEVVIEEVQIKETQEAVDIDVSEPVASISIDAQSELERIVTEAPGDWGVYVKEIGSSEEYSVNVDQVLHPASTIKIPIALALFDWAESEGISTEDLLATYPSGSYRNIERLLDAMLIKSEEDATEILSQYIKNQSGAPIKTIFQEWGAEDTSVYPRKSTASDFGLILEKFYTGDLGISDEATDYLLSVLREESKDDLYRIGAPLPDEVRQNMAHKIGTILDGIYIVSDVAIVSLEDGSSYVVVALGDIGDKEAYNEAIATIQEISDVALQSQSLEYNQERVEQDSNPTVYIDNDFSNVGRLHNLLEVGERLDGLVIPAGESVNLADYAFTNSYEYMNGYAYNSASGFNLGGGICGAASALAKSADLIGIQWHSDARHYPTDHVPGGLYQNLPNASFSSGKDLVFTNTSDKDLVIRIEANYTASDIAGLGDWDIHLDPVQIIGQEEFTFTASFEELIPTEVASVEIDNEVEIVSTPDLGSTVLASFQPTATAVYTQNEYHNSVHGNMQIATATVNDYFLQSANHLSLGNSHFSYLEVMDHFQGEEWQETSSLRGAGACDIATLMYRATRDFAEELGVEVVKIDRDDRGHDIMDAGIFVIRKIDHSEYSGKPQDEIAVASVSPTNEWNSNFEITLNEDLDLPNDLRISFEIVEDNSGNFTVEIISNYSIDQLQDLLNG